jgi:hypothetical protein
MFIQLPRLSSRSNTFLSLNKVFQQIGGCCGLLFWRRTGVHQHPPQTIRHVRASDEGDFDQNPHNWPSFVSYDHSVMNLRIQLGQLQDDWDGEMFGFTLCMRPGSHGRLTPLVTDLPRSLDPMDIVVFRTGSPGDYSAVCAALLQFQHLRCLIKFSGPSLVLYGVLNLLCKEISNRIYALQILSRA